MICPAAAIPRVKSIECDVIQLLYHTGIIPVNGKQIRTHRVRRRAFAPSYSSSIAASSATKRSIVSISCCRTALRVSAYTYLSPVHAMSRRMLLSQKEHSCLYGTLRANTTTTDRIVSHHKR